jgi:hypothetical protein
MVSRSGKNYFTDGCGNSILSHRHWLGKLQDEKTNTEQYNAWQTIQRSHAVQWRSRCKCKPCRPWKWCDEILGRFIVSNPFGTVLAQASHDKEEVIVQEIDTEKTDTYRTHCHSFVTAGSIPINPSQTGLLTKKLMVNGS